MTIHDDIPADMTGSRSQHVERELIQARIPFQVIVKQIDDITRGKITRTYFDWSVVDISGREVARFDYRRDSRPKTRKAAISRAKVGLKEYARYAFAQLKPGIRG